ncbi:hypothetical protein Patl1_07938 [Pistacia atlantica]|uniref:Uncharacterized protein n=1 Tax=Pistacia atlantica TaxID=434234 RepID=A0ACC1AFA2_9ROSI|nr:hypothetical protein Patl1_07938 [Pistacia atlantica]
MSMSSAIVPKVLSDKNYENWKVWLKSYLLGQGLWDIVDGSEAKPIGAGLNAWRKNNGKALHAIQMSCGSDMLTHIREIESAKDAWDRLATVHAHASGARKGFLEAELRACKQGTCTISEYARKVKDICDQLEAIGVRKDNDTRVAIIVENLRPEFDAMRVLVQKNKPTMEEAVSLFLHEEALLERRKLESNNEVKDMSNEAFFSAARGNDHIDTVSTKEQDDGDKKAENIKEALCVIMDQVNTANNQWFIDSACSNHMTPREDIFISTEPFTDAFGVITGDNTRLEIKWRGDIALHKSNGGIQHLSNVLYLPKLCKNLMSVGQLVDQGYNVVFNENGCEILKEGNGTLVATGKKVGRLFALTMLHFSSTKMDSSPNVTILWHKRMGHCNLQRLKDMSMKKLATGSPTISYIEKHICDA